MGELCKSQDISSDLVSTFMLHTEFAGSGGVDGTVCRFCPQSAVSFSGLDQAVLQMNSWMDEKGYYSDEASMRTFQTRNGIHPHMTVVDSAALARCGADQPEIRSQQYTGRKRRGAARKKEAFLVRVICRQHTSWQGEICWRNQKIYFRSCLEMIFLIQSVITGVRSEREEKALSETGTAGESTVAVVS